MCLLPGEALACTPVDPHGHWLLFHPHLGFDATGGAYRVIACFLELECVCFLP